MLDRLAFNFREFPMLQAPVPSSAEIASFVARAPFTLPQDYLGFVSAFGAGIVGPFSVYGIGRAEAMGTDEGDALVVTASFRRRGWVSVAGGLVVSSDHGGNPFVLRASGSVDLQDHDLGGEDVFSSFSEMIRTFLDR